MKTKESVAVYTTMYPGVERYLRTWYKSVLAQTDTNFDMWIGVDKVGIETIETAIGAKLNATWLVAGLKDSPAQIRHNAITKMVERYSAVIFVDSDDLLCPTRIEAAREALINTDVNGCALRIIDEEGRASGLTFHPPTEMKVAELLPTTNVFGLSNTAYRTTTLRKCLPIPATCVLVDWFLATRAWATGARFTFDFTERMEYRQHETNMAPVFPPFTAEQVRVATERVLGHYVEVLTNIPELQPGQRGLLQRAQSRAKLFYESITGEPTILIRYVQALNQLPLKHIWWECVAHPQLEEIWKN